MRKNLLFIGLALSMLAVGCNNGPEEEPKKPSTGKNKVTVTANATLPEGLTWAEGDVYLVNGVEAPALGAEANGAQTVALTVTNPSETSPVLVLGPAALRTGASQVTVGDVQQYVAGGYDRSVRVFAGYAAEALPVEEGNKNNLAADVTLACVQGVLTLPLTLDAAYTDEAPVAVEQVTLTALHNEALCGVYNISSKTVGTDLVPVVSASNPKSSVDLVCAEPAVLGAEAVNFSFVLPAGEYKGFEVVVNDTEGRKYVFNIEETLVVDPAEPKVLESIVYKVVEKAPATLNVTIAESGVVWAAGDTVVCNNELSSEVAASSVGTSSAAFEFTSVAYPYEVFYPADFYSKAGSIRFPSQQVLAKGAYDHKNLVMIGYSATTDVEMKNLCGIVRLPFRSQAGEPLTISEILVESVNGEALSGKYHINYRNCTISPVSPRASMVLTPAANDAVVLNPDDETEFQFVVPAGSFTGGLKLTITTNLEVIETVVAKEGLSVRAGEESSLEQYLYEEVKVPVIATTEDFVAFIKAVNKGRYVRFQNPETGEYMLGADIDLAGVELPAATGEFTDVFNGQGFALKNWVADGPLFQTIAAGGAIKNVKIDSSCSLVATVADNNCAFLAGTSYGAIEGCENHAEVVFDVAATVAKVSAAALVGHVENAYVSNCVNTGSVTYNITKSLGGADDIYCLGGVVGSVVAKGASNSVNTYVTECSNSGAYTLNIGVTSCANLYAGAVVGSCETGSAVENCTNSGVAATTWSNGSAATIGFLRFGGVIGWSTTALTNCSNSAAVTFTSGAGAIVAPAVGGVAAYCSSNLTGCNNSGDVTANGTLFSKAGSATATGVGGLQWPAISGVVGCGGTSASKGKITMTNCHNTGNLLIKNPKGSCRFGAGGVVSEFNGSMSNCSNTGTVDVTGGSQVYQAGVVGYGYYVDANLFENIVNKGTVIFRSGTYYSSPSTTYNYVAGLAGSFSTYTDMVWNNCENRGEVKSYAKNLPTLIGGAFSSLRGTVKNTVNYGKVYAESLHGSSGKNSAVAGFAAFGGGSTVDCANYGDVEVKNTTAAEGYVGASPFLGSVGNTAQSHTGAIVSCNVTSDAPIGLLVAGINNANKAVNLGTEASPIVIKNVVLNGVAVTADNLASQVVVANSATELAGGGKVDSFVFALGSTIVKGE